MSETILAPAAFDPAHPGAEATSLAGDVGNQVVHLAQTLVPVAVPFVLTLVAIRWVMHKFGVSGPASLDAGIGVHAVRGIPSQAYDYDAATRIEDEFERRLDAGEDVELNYSPSGDPYITKNGRTVSALGMSSPRAVDDETGPEWDGGVPGRTFYGTRADGTGGRIKADEYYDYAEQRRRRGGS